MYVDGSAAQRCGVSLPEPQHDSDSDCELSERHQKIVLVPDEDVIHLSCSAVRGDWHSIIYQRWSI
jgi:hypothetical protein